MCSGEWVMCYHGLTTDLAAPKRGWGERQVGATQSKCPHMFLVTPALEDVRITVMSLQVALAEHKREYASVSVLKSSTTMAYWIDQRGIMWHAINLA
eukprot:6457966-Amphidinium_carterae.1